MFKSQHTNKKNTLRLFLTLCFLGVFNALSAQIVITEISPTGEIELKNLGTANVNISTYWLCNFPAYDLISDLTFTCGSAVIEPGKVAVVKGQSVTVPLADGEMGLYTNSSFANSAGLIDYVEWGKAGHTRASLAIAKGIWPANTFLPALTAGQSFQATGNASTAADWKTAVPTLCDIVTEAQPNILVAENAKLGKILTDSTGRTLYVFSRDVKKDTSFCTGGCATTWPVFYKEKLTLGAGLVASDFGTLTRADGKKQTTYKGWPLYNYSVDAAPGDTKGEGVGTFWYVAKPDYAVMFLDNNLKGLDGITYTSKYVPGIERVKYFVDAYGRTLYTFTRDSSFNNNFTSADFSNNGTWPVYVEALGRVPSTVKDSLFKSIDVFGRKQLTYNGWPLYYFGRDTLRGHNKGVSFPVPGRWPVAISTIAVAPSPANIRLVENAKFGSILVDSLGKTLYFFTRDAKKDTSFCNGTCATTWPIFYRANLNLGRGLSLSDFGTITRADGKKQTTYKGWPLYVYSNDPTPGTTNGDGIGTFWYVAKPDYKVMLMDGNLKGLDGVTYTGKYVPGIERVKYLVDAYGRTLYTFTRDSLLKNKFTNSTFSNNVVWPIYNDTLKSFPSGISDTLFKLATVFGRPQLAFKGWPLYKYSQDSVRGQTKGITVGAIGRWPVAAPTLANAPSTITAVQDAFREKLTLRLSPVPTQDVLQVELNSEISGDASGTLYNLNGQAVKQFNFRLYQGKNLTRLDLSTLSTGLYLLSLKIDGQPAAYEKIIKQ